MIDVLIFCGILGVAFMMSVMLFGAQIEQHLRRKVKKWAKDAERKDAQ